jgi:Na+/melibiose symporter-like transporter
MFWNAINDPLFGWLSDTIGKGRGPGKRLPYIRYGGWSLAAAFIFAWFPWSTQDDIWAAVHLFLSLFFFDGALTFVEVNYSSLLADFTTDEALRTKCTLFASAFSIIGALPLFVAPTLWHRDLYSNEVILLREEPDSSVTFSAFCSGVSLLTIPFLEFSYYRLSQFTGGIITENVHGAELENGDKKAKEEPRISVCLFMEQLRRHTNFRLFSCIRLIQVFLCTFEKNHLAFFLAAFAGNKLSRGGLGLLICLSFIAPHFCILASATFIAKLGLKRVLEAILRLKILLCLGCLLLLGLAQYRKQPLQWTYICLYLCGARVLTESVCRLFPMVLAMLGDEDRITNARAHSMAASIIGSSAMVLLLLFVCLQPSPNHHHHVHF